MNRVLRAASASALTATLTTGCLVGDPRPPPGSFVATASSNDSLLGGFVTDDGWSVRYDRFLSSLGHVAGGGDSCTTYSDAAYNRVLDLRVPHPQRLSITYALGPCEIDFEVSSPSENSVLGEGVTAADRDFMRTPVSDDEAAEAGVSIHLEGVATSSAGEKRFSWSFRNRVDYSNCYDESVVSGVNLAGGEATTIDFTARGEVLFQDHVPPAISRLSFAPFAAADDRYGNSDGTITLAELGAVPLLDIQTPDAYTNAAASWKTLEDFVYLGLFPGIVRYRGSGWCRAMDVFPNDRTPR